MDTTAHERVEAYCGTCSRSLPSNRYLIRCPHCRGLIYFRYDWDHVQLREKPHSIWRFSDLLPIHQLEHIVSLGEGSTPLVRSNLKEDGTLLLKNEAQNPTGSVKDRAMSVGISKARELGISRVMNASTGSAGLSTAAYAARAGMRSAIIVPRGAPFERVAAMVAFGALVLPFDGTIWEALRFCEQAAGELGAFQSATLRPVNPYQNEGSKTIAYELWEDQPDQIDWVVAPRGSAGILAGIAHGFEDLQRLGLAHRMPKMAAVELAHLNSMEQSWRDGDTSEKNLRRLALTLDEGQPTIAVKLAHAYPDDGEEALSVIVQSDGAVVSVNDLEITEALQSVARADGLFIEPSSAAALAGYSKLVSRHTIQPGERVAVILTGSGFREMKVIASILEEPMSLYGETSARDRLQRFFARAEGE
ncbi:MAG: threonine synthase [bacterium]